MKQIRLSDFHFLLDCLSEPFDNFSISTLDDNCLKVKTSIPFLTLGLMQGPQLLKSFFALTDDVVFFHNEPSLGCTQFSSIHFIFSKNGFNFCINKSFPMSFENTQNSRNVALKIPPFPIVENNKINNFIFDSLKLNPSISDEFIDLLRSSINDLLIFKDQFSHLVKTSSHFLTKEVCQKYLQFCAEEAKFKFKQKVYSQSQTEIPFGGSHLLKLKLLTDEMGIKIDFQGTSPSDQISLSDLATDSVCFSLLCQYFQMSHKMNSSVFALFQIIKPMNSFVSSKITNNLIASEKLGVPLLMTALHHCLWKIYGKNQTAPHNYFTLPVQIKNDHGDYLYFNLLNGRSFYFQNNYHQDKGYLSKNNSDGSLFPTLAQFEKLGLQVLSVSERPLKSIKSSASGGPGWIFKLRTKQKLSLTFFSDPIANSFNLEKNLTVYEPTQVLINHKPISGDSFTGEVPGNSELTFISGYSPSIA